MCRRSPTLPGGQFIEAEPLLEAGFNNREQAEFDSPEMLVACASALAGLRGRAGDLDGAVEALQVAHQIIAETDSLELEGLILVNLGLIYHLQGEQEESEATWQKARAILEQSDTCLTPSARTEQNYFLGITIFTGNGQLALQLPDFAEGFQDR